MLNLPRWKLNGGRDFVFYDSHPGFVAGHSAPAFVGMFCNEFRHATHIVVERAQRNVCQARPHPLHVGSPPGTVPLALQRADAACVGALLAMLLEVATLPECEGIRVLLIEDRRVAALLTG